MILWSTRGGGPCPRNTPSIVVERRVARACRPMRVLGRHERSPPIAREPNATLYQARHVPRTRARGYSARMVGTEIHRQPRTASRARPLTQARRGAIIKSLVAAWRGQSRALFFLSLVCVFLASAFSTGAEAHKELDNSRTGAGVLERGDHRQAPSAEPAPGGRAHGHAKGGALGACNGHCTVHLIGFSHEVASVMRPTDLAAVWLLTDDRRAPANASILQDRPPRG